MCENVIEKLSLRIKREYLDKIIAGTKKFEYREASPFYDSRLLNFVDRKKGTWNSVKQVKVLHLYVGNNTTAKWAKIEVKRTLLYNMNFPQSYPERGIIKGVPDDIEEDINIAWYVFELGDIKEHNY